MMAIVIPFYVNHKGQEIGQKNRDAIGNMSSFLLESYRGLSTLLQYHAGNKRLEQMNERSDCIEDMQGQMKNIEATQIVSSQLLISISSFVMFIVMYIFYLQNQVNVYQKGAGINEKIKKNRRNNSGGFYNCRTYYIACRNIFGRV